MSGDLRKMVNLEGPVYTTNKRPNSLVLAGFLFITTVILVYVDRRVDGLG